MNATSPARQLAGFLARYTPEVRAVATAALARLRRRLPGAVELVYDNYNGLVIGFGPTDRASDAIFSLVLYPRWVTLFFLHGATLADPRHLLKGCGRRVRHIVLDDASVLDRPPVRALMARALRSAPTPLDRGARRRMIIKSVSAKQRPRRPAAGPRRPRSRRS